MKKLKITTEMVVFSAGVLLFAVGTWFIYPPAALLASGVILMAISVFGDKP